MSQRRADLSIDLSPDSNTNAAVGDSVSFTATVRNLGPHASPPRRVAILIPANVTLNGLSDISCQNDVTPTVLVCDLPSIGAPRGRGESSVVQTSAFQIALGPIDPGLITVSAYLERDRSDLRLGNNSARATRKVGTLVGTYSGPTPESGTSTNEEPGEPTLPPDKTPTTQTPGGSATSTTASTTTTTTVPEHPAPTTTTHHLQ